MALSCRVPGNDRRCQGVYRVVDVPVVRRAGFSGSSCGGSRRDPTVAAR